jgi:uncharacterized membrane protein
VWALLAKLATRSLAPETVLVVSYLVGSAIGLVALVLTLDGPITGMVVDTPGLTYAVGAGVASGLGSVVYYAGLKSGSVSVVSTVTGLYFVVATVLGILLLGESISASTLLGVAFAVGAVVLLAG